ncbi:MAG: type II CRISPR RNA-guided endonuclease Cas9 [Prevotella sp.]|nr:type II CRISPR RNA-guided endonuclease Cas9 [Prevotella sp.]
MKTILGLDLGVASIGWALILVTDDYKPVKIIRLGVRRIPVTPDDIKQFTTGSAFTKNQNRTKSRTARKGYERYKQRRERLTEELRRLGMLPDESLIKLPVLDLWRLRANAAKETEKLSLAEIGRVLYHINQKRGYKHSKADVSKEAKEKEYVAQVNGRYETIRSLGMTIGQYFASKLEETAVKTDKGVFYTFRTKEQVFPRAAYEEEFDRIMDSQRKYYPDILTDGEIDRLRNYIIFYQRDLKSCKHLIGICELEKHLCDNGNGKIVTSGPRVAATSNPLFQLDKLWEEVNNISITDKYGHELFISQEQKNEIVQLLNKKPVLKLTELYKILKINKSEWYSNASLKKGLQGNTTVVQLREALGDTAEADRLLRFNLTYKERELKEETGEPLLEIAPSCMEEPLYKLWHIVYSIKDKENLAQTLRKQLGISDPGIINRLYDIDFGKDGYGNKSVRAIRRILPYLQEGLKYSDACKCAGYNHSNSLTKEENLNRNLLDSLPQLQKNELRQPMVEKVLNQMVNIVNRVMLLYGRPDTIRVELARELKQSREERYATSKRINERERENNRIAKHLKEEGIRATRNKIERYKLWCESGRCCFYCGQPIGEKAFLEGGEVETEHIIPKSLLFDNSFSNKVCSCRKCNKEKDNQTAFDFMSHKDEFDDYVRRVNDMFSGGKISKTKRDRLLTCASDIPQDFINRDLRLTQYISRKAMEILKNICFDVTASTGGVTDFIRHTWGYDDVLHQLNFQRYKEGGLTEMRIIEHRGQAHEKEVIKDWNKRLDHRHHAIDALVVAMTRQNFIQRMNTLNASRDVMFSDISVQDKQWRHDYSLLQEWLREKEHFSTDIVKESVAGLIVSCRPEGKVASTGRSAIFPHGKRKIVQRGVVIPRGALHEESVYGKIKDETGKGSYVIKYKLGIGAVGFLFNGKETYKEEIKINKKTGVPDIKITDKIKDVLDSVVDGNIRRRILERLNEGCPVGQSYKDNVSKALENFKDISKRPLYTDDIHKIPIHSVRCKTGLSVVVPLRYNQERNPIGFVKPGHNHHISIYQDAAGVYHECVTTFWQAVERKRLHLPVIIESPSDLWDKISDRNLPQSILSSFPEPDWKFVFSMQRKEMFVLGMEDDDFLHAIKGHKTKRIE